MPSAFRGSGSWQSYDERFYRVLGIPEAAQVSPREIAAMLLKALAEGDRKLFRRIARQRTTQERFAEMKEWPARETWRIERLFVAPDAKPQDQRPGNRQ